jgi:hypothetical protein
MSSREVVWQHRITKYTYKFRLLVEWLGDYGFKTPLLRKYPKLAAEGQASI